MPLDALNGRTCVSLADYLTSIGVVPIPLADLEAHKKEQVRRNPPNLLLTPKPYVALALVIYVGIIAMGARDGFLNALMAISTGWVCGALVGVMSAMLFAIVCHVFNIRLRGHAQWIESYATRGRSLNPSIPPAIREVAEYVRANLPRSYTVYGELIQRNELIDPYLVIQMPASPMLGDTLPWSGERVCLGIWEDDRVIRVAEVLGD